MKYVKFNKILNGKNNNDLIAKKFIEDIFSQLCECKGAAYRSLSITSGVGRWF